MDETIFKRVESKYVLDKEDYNNIINTIKKNMLKDVYFESSIYNIYFDNDNDDIIIKSLNKPIFKYKVRSRSYNINNNKIFFEIKTKYKGVVYKRRTVLTKDEYNDYINNNSYNHRNQIMKEIDYYIKYNNLSPKIFIAYDRYSYKSKNTDLRITFDYNLRSRKENLDVKNDSNNIFYFKDDKYIMEIKTSYNYPLWLAELLNKYKIYPSSFSKYGKIYEKLLNEEMIK